MSYDFVSLYTSVPQDQAMNLVKDKLFRDPELSERTKIPAKSIIHLWEIVINNTFFTFNGKLYKKVSGLAIMGRSTSAFAAEIFMYEFEKHAFTTFAHPPEIWSRYVDDTKTKFKIAHTPLFLAHLNSFDQRLQFTEELMDPETLNTLM